MKLILMMFVLFVISATTLKADTYTYYGLNTVGDIQNRNLDRAFWDASVKGTGEKQTFLSSVKHLVGSNDIVNQIPNTWKSINANKIVLAETYDVRAYFVGEDTGTMDSFGFNAGNNPLLIFPNASTAVKYQNGDNKNLNENLRTTSCPLFPGDFVNMGRLREGNKLDFFLIRDGFNTKPGIGLPPEMCNCVCFAQADNPYVLISIPRCGGSNSGIDSNTLFAIFIGSKNTNNLINPPTEVPAPEPIMFIPVFGAGCILVYIRSKRSVLNQTN